MVRKDTADSGAAYERFERAPIVEAVLDIRVSASESVDLDLLARYQARIADDYPTKEVRSTWTTAVELRTGSEPVSKASGGPIGYLFKSKDGKRVVQARRDGFTFSQLKPYQDWGSLSAHAKALWIEYVELVRPKTVSRVALRYINRIELPSPVELKDYFLTLPEIAPALPQHIASFFYRVVLPQESTKGVAIVTQAVDDARRTDTSIPIIFDIDVFRQGIFPVTADKLWPMFVDLRHYKNQVFHESITERTKDLFR